MVWGPGGPGGKRESADGDLLPGQRHGGQRPLLQQRHGKGDAPHAAAVHQEDDDPAADGEELPGDAGGHSGGADGGKGFKQHIRQCQGLDGGDGDGADQCQQQVGKQHRRGLLQGVVPDAAAKGVGALFPADAGEGM